MKKAFAVLLVALIAMASVMASGAGEGTATVSTDGSTSMEKVILSLAEQYMADNPDVNVTYNPTGSGTGITAALEGRCDIGLSSRALKDSEKESGLTETVLAYDGIAIIPEPSISSVPFSSTVPILWIFPSLMETSPWKRRPFSVMGMIVAFLITVVIVPIIALISARFLS